MQRFLLVVFMSSSIAINLQDYKDNYLSSKDTYERTMAQLNDAIGPYETARDAYISATSTYTHSLYPNLETSSNSMLSSIFKLEHNYWSSDRTTRELVAKKYIAEALHYLNLED